MKKVMQVVDFLVCLFSFIALLILIVWAFIGNPKPVLASIACLSFMFSLLNLISLLKDDQDH